jgi:hypothetical protein
MTRSILTAANRQLFERRPDERFDNLSSLYTHCQQMQENSTERWARSVSAGSLMARRVTLDFTENGMGESLDMNDWSFGQVCRLAGVAKETVNRLTPDTAALVLRETLPQLSKPVQLLVRDGTVRSIHGPAYTRLQNTYLLNIVREFAVDFQPPQTGMNGATGLYAGEQDMFVFLIDPTGWVEIEGEAFAPGMFLWNSEVGCRSVGLQTFWFQAVCQNHIVWDAVEVIEFSRKHTANVHECLSEVRRHIENLVKKRDDRRDGFARVMANAFKTRLGDDAEAVAKVLAKQGIPRDLGKKALKMAQEQGRFTVFSLVDALTRLAGEYQNAGDRLEADEKAGRLLELASV